VEVAAGPRSGIRFKGFGFDINAKAVTLLKEGVC
jgi:hypothetical protein